MRNRILEFSLIIVATLVGYAIVELLYRGWLYYSQAVDAQFVVTTVDARISDSGFGRPGNVLGMHTPDTSVTFSNYGPDSRLLARHQVKTNNLGWVSKYPYSPEKSEGEFRIAVVGDSLTESITNAVPWPDELQDRLNENKNLLKSLGASKVSVLNFGVSGASMQFMANPLALIAMRFHADLVIVNFVAEDLSRRHSDTFESLPSEPPELISAPIQIALQKPEIVIDDIEVPLYCAEGHKADLRDPACRASPLWYVPPTLNLSEKQIHQYKQKIARKLLLHRVLLSPQPLALNKILESRVIRLPFEKTQVEATAASNSPKAEDASADIGRIEAEDIDFGLRSIRLIKTLHRNVIVTHNPMYWHLTRSRIPSTYEPFVEQLAKAGTVVARMEQYLPTHLGEREWFSWYMLPRDGHWSDHGSRVYAQAMAQVVHERLVGKAADSGRCDAAYTKYIKAKQSLVDDAPKGRTLLTDAIKSLPADGARAGKASTSYRQCGFVSELYGTQARLLELDGNREAAGAMWNQALIASNDRYQVLKDRIAVRSLEEYSVPEILVDWDSLVALRPADADLLIGRGDLHLKSGDAVRARQDFIAANKLRAPDAGTLFRLAQAAGMLKEYAEAVEVLTQALKLLPKNAGLLVARANALAADGHPKEALRDLNDAIEIEPKQKAYFVYRAGILRSLNKVADAERDLATASRLQ